MQEAGKSEVDVQTPAQADANFSTTVVKDVVEVAYQATKTCSHQ